MVHNKKWYVKTIKKAAYLTALVIALSCIASFPVSADEEAGNTSGGKAVVNELISDIGFSSVLYDAENGLPTSDANTVLSTSDGFMWIGGYSGLIRYDGTTFERQDHSGGITSVNALYEDSKGRLWVGTNDNGVVCLYKGESRHFSYEEGLDEASVSSLAEDSSGNILIGTKEGIYYIKDDMTVGALGDAQITDAYITELKSDISGRVCGVTNSGALFRITGLRVTEYYNGSDLDLSGVCAILPSPHNKDEIWLGTDQGVVCEASFADNFSNIKKNSMYYKPSSQALPMLASEPVQELYYCEGRVFVLMGSRIFLADGYGGFRQLENVPLDGGIEIMTEIGLGGQSLVCIKKTGRNEDRRKQVL